MQKNYLLALMAIAYLQTEASLPAPPGERLWNIINCTGVITTSAISKICRIESQTDTLFACAPEAISQATTIDSAGNYCLTTEIDYLAISAHDVVVDLNGRTINGTVTIYPGQHHIQLHNGTIAPSAQDGLWLHGEPNASIYDILLNDLTIEHALLGICIHNAHSIAIKDSYIIDSDSIGIDISCADAIIIRDCILDTAGNTCLQAHNTNTVSIDGCAATQAAMGFHIIDSACVALTDCVSEMHTMTAFTIASPNVVIDNCIAAETPHGFSFAITNDNAILNSLAQECSVAGFEFSNTNTNTAAGLAKQNVALSNNAFGYKDNNSTMRYVASIAILNGTDYSPASGAPFNPTITPGSYWRNTLG